MSQAGDWRVQVLDVGTLALAAVGTPVSLFVVWQPVGSPWVDAALALTMALVWLAALWRAGPRPLRATAVIVAMLIVQSAALVRVGFTVGVFTSALCAVFAAGLLLGVRWGLAVWVVTCSIMVGGALTFGLGLVDVPHDPRFSDPSDLMVGVRFSLAYGTLSILMAVGVSALVAKLGESLRRSDQTLRELRKAQVDVQRANRELDGRVRERTAELAAANRELNAFAHSVSHDLRAPLRLVAGFSELLSEKHSAELSEPARRHLDRIQRSVTRMQELVDDLLRLSRITATDLKRESVDLGASAAAILEDLRAGSPERQVESHIAEGLEDYCDPRMARILLENLLSNAWKYTQGRNPARIEVGRVKATPATFFVEDNGVGFDMGQADQLFVPFQRLHSPRQFEGTGVGLATAERIVRLHGGHIAGVARPGLGAKFTFSLSEPPAESGGGSAVG